MERSIRYTVDGIGNARKAARVEERLYGRDGIREVHGDPETGRIWMRYDDERIPPPRLEEYLRDAGADPVAEA